MSDFNNIFGENNIIDFSNYDELFKNIVRKNKLVVFIGAGLSRIGGCKSWIELANELVNFLFDKKIINFVEKDELLNIARNNPKKGITISYQKYKNNDLQEEYKNILIKSVEPIKEKDKKNFIDIHKKVTELSPLFYITTNYDNGLEEAIPNKPVNLTNLKEEIIDIEKYFKDENIFYLHGSKDKIENVILTSEQYYEFYYHPQSVTNIKFLQHLFSDKYTVLFIGYGLDEYEILQNLFVNKSKDVKLKHILLSPIFSSDSVKFNLEKTFFEIHGVTAIPYNIDERGYEILFEVIDLLKEEFHKYAIERYSKIDSALRINDLSILNDLNTEVEKTYFFRKVKSIDYFDAIQKKGHLNPETIPFPEQKEQSYIVPYWEPNQYLIKVSEKIKGNSEKYKSFIQKIIDIINNITNFFRDIDAELFPEKSNYRVWYQFVEIISNLPEEYITKEFLESNLSVWLKDSDNHNIIAEDILERLAPNFLTGKNNDRIYIILNYLLQVRIYKDYSNHENRNFITEYYIIEILFNKNKENILEVFDKDFAAYLIDKTTGLLQDKYDESYYSIYFPGSYPNHSIKVIIIFLQDFIKEKGKVGSTLYVNIVASFF